MQYDNLNDLYHILHHNTRQLDCYCDFSKNKVMLLLPETSILNTNTVIEKIVKNIDGNVIYSVVSMEKELSIKELLQKVTRCDGEEI